MRRRSRKIEAGVLLAVARKAVGRLLPAQGRVEERFRLSGIGTDGATLAMGVDGRARGVGGHGRAARLLLL
jgi:hypothetical protein